MPATIGNGRPFENKPATDMAAAPVSICSVPSSAEAVPAMAPCFSSASTAVVGITRPMNVLAMKYKLGLNKILGSIHTYPTLAEANKYAAGNWKRAHAPQQLLAWVERFHAWRRG